RLLSKEARRRARSTLALKEELEELARRYDHEEATRRFQRVSDPVGEAGEEAGEDVAARRRRRVPTWMWVAGVVLAVALAGVLGARALAASSSRPRWSSPTWWGGAWRRPRPGLAL